MLGALAGTFKSVGDLVSSPLSDEEWKAIALRGIDQGDPGAGKAPAHRSRVGKRRKAR